MSYQVIESEGHPIKAWIEGVELEDQARQQLLNIAQLPFIHRHIAVMPDVHWGMGATVGSVIATKSAIVPAAVGVDIGCGMMALHTSLTAVDLPDSLKDLRTAIEVKVPHGRTNDGKQGDRGAYYSPNPHHVDVVSGIMYDFHRIIERHPKLERPGQRIMHHAGTLGTGNHFIEVCLDENDAVWVMLHSGSRGIGNAIGTYFINLAREDMVRQDIHLPDRDLAYLTDDTDLFHDYWMAVKWAQSFAAINRGLMMGTVLNALKTVIQKDFTIDQWSVNCHHNYVSKEIHFDEEVYVTRKGAVAATYGLMGIIPGSMGDRSYIVRGKGNPESFCSCSHGAGRRMSRGEAKRRFTVEDHIKATEGVECRKDINVIDETPMAYKDIDAVMAAQEDLVEVVHTLRQVLCVKG